MIVMRDCLLKMLDENVKVLTLEILNGNKCTLETNPTFCIGIYSIPPFIQ